MRFYAQKWQEANEKSKRRYKKLRKRQGPLPVRSNFVNDVFLKKMMQKNANDAVATVEPAPQAGALQIDILSGNPTPKSVNPMFPNNGDESVAKLKPDLIEQTLEENTFRTDENSVSQIGISDSTKNAKPQT